ncbi:hypothetical protein [Sphingomonas sp.]|uniref:hypothetical protein n=1 Tax=Sphingomonas sp. TaxID=28214 RepID=UPI003B3A961B
MFKAILRTYRSAGAFAMACPLLFFVPVLPELAQHIAEYRMGLFSSFAHFQADATTDTRMVFGTIKVLVLLLPRYWVARFAWWGDGARAGRWESAAVRAYVAVFLYSAVVNLGALWIPQLISGRAGTISGLASLPLLLVLDILLAQWIARAPLGDGSASIGSSLRLIAPDFLWALGFSLLATLPVMAGHYALNFLALGKPPAMTGLVLAADSIFVGYLVAILCIIPVTITRHAEARRERRRARQRID